MDQEEDIKIEPEVENSERSEEFEDPEREEHAEGKMRKLQEELNACRKEKQEYMDGWQRAKADYVNMLKRGNNEIKDAQVKGIAKAVEALFPAFDAIERAKDHGEIPEGFQAIIKQLEIAFKSLGLIEVETKFFDPALHEALAIEPVKNKEKDNFITVVLEKGWRIDGGPIIRPAKVRVAHFANEK
ncbi:MAG: nucleotide exchange factor GrpE [Candidatus Kaiserbacteria bacterium]|nr:nucleotide exchange factor GrpE [Candidatus Kaiserbacteria bacterium]